ncbi:MAG: MBL fold metallo-hydrolase [Gammaproteobacteria bacterium]|nr:MBL fold metallo-hydrolase [Gammaproteobacteria bacterium]
MKIIISMLLLAWPIYTFAEEPLVPLKISKITANIYALVGELDQRSPANLGNNATFGVIVTQAGVVLIDSGGSYKGAEQIASAIKSITDKPVITVINTGGQDQRWLGNGYFRKKGAKIITSSAALKDQRRRFNSQIETLDRLIGSKNLEGTQAVYADQTFDSQLDITIGTVHFNIQNPAPAHTPGDSFVWLPEYNVMFTGDIVYVSRMLTIGSMSNSSNWIKAFETLSAYKPTYIIPGHGDVTDLKQATTDTYDYLTFLHSTVKDFIDQGKGLESISDIDQTRFSYLKFYEQIAARNAHQVFLELEWQ